MLCIPEVPGRPDVARAQTKHGVQDQTEDARIARPARSIEMGDLTLSAHTTDRPHIRGSAAPHRVEIEAYIVDVGSSLP
jgi:hypothetical protein